MLADAEAMVVSYLTAERDLGRIAADATSARSLRHWSGREPVFADRDRPPPMPEPFARS